MQRQQESEPEQSEKRPKPQRKKRSIGELLVAWLVLLWGLVNAIIMGPTFLTMNAHWLVRAMGYCIFFHFVCALVGGISALLRYRVLAYWFLHMAAFCLFLIGILNLASLREPGVAVDWSYLASLGLLAAFFSFLAYGLGRQEEIAE